MRGTNSSSSSCDRHVVAVAGITDQQRQENAACQARIGNDITSQVTLGKEEVPSSSIPQPLHAVLVSFSTVGNLVTDVSPGADYCPACKFLIARKRIRPVATAFSAQAAKLPPFLPRPATGGSAPAHR